MFLFFLEFFWDYSQNVWVFRQKSTLICIICIILELQLGPQMPPQPHFVPPDSVGLNANTCLVCFCVTLSWTSASGESLLSCLYSEDQNRTKSLIGLINDGKRGLSLCLLRVSIRSPWTLSPRRESLLCAEQRGGTWRGKRGAEVAAKIICISEKTTVGTFTC